jgi:hypothetical protein
MNSKKFAGESLMKFVREVDVMEEQVTDKAM